jgi:hypothetical protein
VPAWANAGAALQRLAIARKIRMRIIAPAPGVSPAITIVHVACNLGVERAVFIIRKTTDGTFFTNNFYLLESLFDLLYL